MGNEVNRGSACDGKRLFGEELMVKVEGEVAGLEVMGDDKVRGIEGVGVIGEDETGVLDEEMVGMRGRKWLLEGYG